MVARSRQKRRATLAGHLKEPRHSPWGAAFIAT